MSEAGWTFRTFVDSDGSRPVDDFLSTLRDAERNQMRARLEIIQAQGLNVRHEILETLGKNLYCLRVPNTPNNPRLFLVAIEPKTMVAVYGFKKHTKKIPDSDMQIAKTRCAMVMNDKTRYLQ